MKRIILPGILAFISYGSFAQAKSSKNNAPKKISKSNPVAVKQAPTAADTATFTGVHIDEHKVKSFDPMNAKIRNLPVKTPVYQPNVTGTNAPGDGRMGLPVQAPLSNERSTYPVVIDSIKTKTSGN